MGKTGGRSGGRQAGGAGAFALSLAIIVALTGSTPVLAIEPPANGPQPPRADELTAAAELELVDEPTAVELPDMVQTADQILEYAWSLPAEDWDIESLAAELDFDPLAAYRFVRDHIRYEPYAGVLRGADGALAARAGNSLDRSLLLAALLDEMLVDYEFAMAHLDDTTVAEVVDAARKGPPKQLDEELPGAHIDTASIADRARRDYALLRSALGTHLPLDGGIDEAAALVDAREHVWLRMPFGAETLDLDTTLPGAEPGRAIADPERTIQTLAQELRHTVRLQVVLEELDHGIVSERVVLDESLDAIDASERELFLMFEPDLTGYAGAITAVLSGDERWSPILLRDGERIEGHDFSLGGRGQDLLGDPTDLPEPVTLRLVVTTEGPGVEPLQATHVLVDRRTDGQLPGSLAAHAPLVPLTVEAGVPTALTGISNIAVSTGGSNPRTFAYRLVQVLDFIAGVMLDEEVAAQYSLADRLWPMAMAGEGLVQASEQVLVPAAGGDAGHGYVARPRVYLTSVAPAADDPEISLAITDLMIDGVRILPRVPGTPTAPGQLWYGALQSALETELALRAADALAGGDPPLAGTSLSTRPPLTVLAPEAGAALDRTHAALRRDLESGLFVVLAGDAVTAESWWSIDPRSGVTRAMLVSGMRGVDRPFKNNENLWERRGGGAKSVYKRQQPPGGSQRGAGDYPRNWGDPPKAAKNPNPNQKLIRERPPTRQGLTPRCQSVKEYPGIICNVSRPTAVLYYAFAATTGLVVIGFAYALWILILGRV